MGPEDVPDPDATPTKGPSGDGSDEAGREETPPEENLSGEGRTVFSFQGSGAGIPETLREKPGTGGKSVSGILRKQDGIASDVTLPSPDLPDTVFEGPGGEARYEILDEIGRGGMGAILRLVDRDIRRPVAMKVILGSDDRGRTARFVEEAQITGQLEHPNIVPVHEIGLDPDGRLYFTMKLVKGESLETLLDRVNLAEKAGPAAVPEGSAPLPTLSDLLHIYLKVCDAVAFAHSKSVIHRDLKPENVMVGRFGEVQVMDWGLAKVLGREDAAGEDLVATIRSEAPAGKTLEGEVMGTPSYMPPEQADGRLEEIDERSDIFALGAILYRILTLDAPYTGETSTNVLVKAVEGEVVPPRERRPERPIPAELEAACLKAMAKKKEDRYAGVKELQADIRAFLEGRTLEAVRYGAHQILWKWMKRKKAFVIPSLLGLTALLVLGGWFVLSTAQKNRRIADERDLARRNEQEAVAARQDEKKARARAETAADQARKEKRLAVRRLADGLVAQGDVLGASSRWREAKALYAKARETYEGLGVSVFPAALGAWNALRVSPPALAAFEGGEGIVQGAGFLPGSARVFCASQKSVRILDAITGRVLEALPVPEVPLTSAVLSDDGRFLLTGNAAGEITAWDVETGEAAKELAGHRGPAACLDISPDGRLALSGGWQGEAKLWDLETGTVVKDLPGHARALQAVAFSPDGKLAVTAGGYKDNTLILRDLAGAEEDRTVQMDWIGSVAFSPDGSRLVVGCGDGRIDVLDTSTWKPLRSIPGHDGPVYAVAVSPDGRTILSGGPDGTVRVRDLETGETLRVFTDPEGSVYALAFSPDGRLVLSGDEEGIVRIWELGEDLQARLFPEHDGYVQGAAFSPDGRLVVTANEDFSAKLWDVETGRLLRGFVGHAEAVLHGVDYAPGGTRILTAGTDATVRVWDAFTGEAILVLAGHEKGVSTAAFSPDGAGILSGGYDEKVVLWDAGSGEAIWSLDGRGDVIEAAAFSPDGRWVVTESPDGALGLLASDTGETIRAFGKKEDFIQGVDVSPDGSRVLCGHGKILQVWETGSGRERHALAGHTETVGCVRFFPGGRLAASTGGDHTLRIWDTVAGREIRTIRGTPEDVATVALSPDGTRAVTEGRKDLRLWDFSRASRSRALQGRVGEARAMLAKDPEDAPALGVLGTWYAFRGQWRGALDCFERAREAGGEGPSPLLLGRCRWLAGRLAGAAEAFRDAAERGLAPAPYIALLLHAIEQERIIEEAERRLAADPEDAEALATRGAARFAKGAVGEALADFEKAVAIDAAKAAGKAPAEIARLFALRGEARIRRGTEPEKALADGARALALDEACTRGYYVRGAARCMLKKIEEGLADLDRFLEAEPDHAWGHLGRAYAYMMTGKAEKAVADASRAIELDPKLPDARLVRGMIHRKMGRHEKAVEDLKAYLELVPNISTREQIEAYIRSVEGK